LTEDRTHAAHGGVVLVGVTASGKSKVALDAARARSSVEIVSVDSMCVYRSMDIATAKPSASDRALVRHHLIDLVEPSEEFSLADFQLAARAALSDIAGRGGTALMVGGTGLYHRAVIDDLNLPGRWPALAAELNEEATARGSASLHERLANLDPLAASRIVPTNQRRVVRALEVTLGAGVPFSSFGPGLDVYPASPHTLLGLTFEPDVADERIAARFARWMNEGLLEEVQALAECPGGLSKTARQALGYKELLAHVEGGLALAECEAEAVRRTRAFARRQWAWFRRDPRIRWIGPDEDPAEALAAALDAQGAR
jgi:tRNA dimethylallyltransferase